MFFDASGFHPGSFALALSFREVHPAYRLRLNQTAVDEKTDYKATRSDWSERTIYLDI
jgi:hypothetical protein